MADVLASPHARDSCCAVHAPPPLSLNVCARRVHRIVSAGEASDTAALACGVCSCFGRMQKTLRERKDPFSKDHNVTLLDFADVEAVAPLGTCALVGNSGVLIGRPLGPLIDAHSTVMRLNQARLNLPPPRSLAEVVGVHPSRLAFSASEQRTRLTLSSDPLSLSR